MRKAVEWVCVYSFKSWYMIIKKGNINYLRRFLIQGLASRIWLTQCRPYPKHEDTGTLTVVLHQRMIGNQ